MLVILIIIGVAALVVLLLKHGQHLAERERQRLAGLHDWAEANGFTFSPEDAHNLADRFDGILEIGPGHDRYAYEVLARSDPVPAFIFQYHYKTWETRTVTYTDSQGRIQTRTETYEQSHWCRYLFIELGAAFPDFSIRREGWFDKLIGLMGFDDINFESEAFSRQYHVKSPDRQFAYSLIHPQMMEWLMGRPVALQLQRGMLLMTLGGGHDAASCHEAWSEAVGFINRVQRFVWEDFAKRPQVVFPEPQAPVPVSIDGDKPA